MTITRTFCSASLLALAAIMGPVAPGYAGEPCCDWVYGKYINLKTGKEVKPPKGTVAPGSVESAASAANRYCAKPAEATAPPECSFSSMKDCRASLWLTTGRAVPWPWFSISFCSAAAQPDQICCLAGQELCFGPD
jgi:hypothetical protein